MTIVIELAYPVLVALAHPQLVELAALFLGELARLILTALARVIFAVWRLLKLFHVLLLDVRAQAKPVLASRSDTVHRSCYPIDTVHRAQLGTGAGPRSSGSRVSGPESRVKSLINESSRQLLMVVATWGLKNFPWRKGQNTALVSE